MSKPKIVEEVPISEKYLLTVYEAAQLSGLGINKLQSMVKEPKCEFTLVVGERKKMIVREKLRDYLLSRKVV